MYGGSGKLGRGGGRTGGNSRMSYPPLSAVRPPLVPAAAGGGPRNRLSSSVKPGSTAASVGVEEHLSLVPGSNPLSFAMIIRLTPDLVEEIRKVEAQGGNARIKFNANANNTTENVIDVGGKEFRFTWSCEMGGLCDIYEEREIGGNGDGLLVESSCAWRKLNVQRVLDESTTSQVKMRSVEAELKHKSRQAIVLDHGNPTTKNQLKQFAAAESYPFRNSYKQKKEPPFKKRKFDASPGGGSSRPLSQKHVLSSSSPASVKSTRLGSPLLSTPSQVGGSVSPYGASNVITNHAIVDDPRYTQSSSKDDTPSNEKDGTGKAAYVMHGSKGKGSANSVELRSKLVSILTENPKGMTVKALEVAVGDAFPNASKEIEVIVELIANFQPSSGRYVLKQGIESESYKDQLSEIEGMCEHANTQKHYVPERRHQQSPSQEATFSEKLCSEENQEPLRYNIREDTITVDEKVFADDHDVPGHPGSPNKSDYRAGSSGHSASDSDSDTDTSDSRSDSKSKSAVGSGSSSSDSDSSKNSKEGTDEDVDIISEDEKEKKVKLVSSSRVMSSSHVPWRTPDTRPSQNSVYDNDGDYGPVRVEIEKILPDEDEDAEIDVVSDTPPYNAMDKSQTIRDLYLPSYGNHREFENCGVTDNVVKEHWKISSPDRVSKGKTRRGSDAGNMDEKSDWFKRLKSENLPPHPKSRSKKADAYDNFSSECMENDKHMDSPLLGLHRCDGNDDGVKRQKVSRDGQSGQLSNNQPFNQKVTKNMSNSASRNEELGCGSNNSKRSSQMNRGFPPQCNNSYGDTQNEDVDLRNNLSMNSDSRSKKPEAVGRYTGAQQISKPSFGLSPKDDDGYAFINGESKQRRRELSDLEMGELRDPVPEELVGINKKFEKEGFFKKVSSKQGMSHNQSINFSKLIPVTTEPIEQRDVSPPTSRSRAPNNTEGLLNKWATDKTKKPQHRTFNSQIQSHVDMNQVANNKKNLSSKAKHDDKRRQVFQTNADNSTDLIEENGALFPEQKRRESSSDENSCSYTKFEKDEPDLKGPIKDFAQYKEYVQEYNSKYNTYSSINKILETDRDDFLKLGKELENAKGKDEDKYNNVLSRLMDSYRRSGTRHKRLKKIFLVLHEELKQLKEMIKDFAVAYTKD